MNTAISLRCGHFESIRSAHHNFARSWISKQLGQKVDFNEQRSAWCTAAAGPEGMAADAVAIVTHVDKKGRFIPIMTESTVEEVAPNRLAPKATANVAYVFGEPESASSLLLADAMPRYLHLVSSCATLLAVSRPFANQLNKSFGWTNARLPTRLLEGFVAVVCDGNPATSVCGRAIAFGREARGPNRLQIDSLNAAGKSPTVLLADEDAQQLTLRAWDNWICGEPRALVFEWDDGPTPIDPEQTYRDQNSR